MQPLCGALASTPLLGWPSSQISCRGFGGKTPAVFNGPCSNYIFCSRPRKNGNSCSGDGRSEWNAVRVCEARAMACDARPPRLLFSCFALLLLSSHRDLPCKRSSPISQRLPARGSYPRTRPGFQRIPHWHRALARAAADRRLISRPHDGRASTRACTRACLHTCLTDRTRRKLCVAATTRRGTRRAAAQKRGRQPTKQEQYKPRQPHRLDRGAVLISTCHCTARATSPPGPLTSAARRWKPPPPPSLIDDASLRGASCDRRRRVRAACAARRPGVPRTCAHV